ncbi:NAD(P)-binding protein [Epidermidibacterium keratini]|uniref:NAD(P)-binding protein n=2 Tax=Epidermidibacterium keratini TaxID=1891644 RepID=A0A7L4YPH5_9ACTN|nr:NAD(P)-binding protein [Epidermidibacterium keratini]
MNAMSTPLGTRTAVVVGSGPNGLTAAVRLARSGVRVRVVELAERIGGGTRTSELTEPGLLHDDCAAFHPTGVVSPAFLDLRLKEFGLRWQWPEVQLAHPLDDGTAGVLYRDIDRTAADLGVDGDAWKRLMGPVVRRFPGVVEGVLGPVLRVPRHPVAMGVFGLRAALPATVLARTFKTQQAKALFGGIAAHSFDRLDRPLTSAVGVMLGAAGHVGGWPVAHGGSRAITDALAEALRSYGGTIETGVRVKRLRDIPADVRVMTLSTRAAIDVIGDALPDGVRRAYRRFRYGPGAHKVEFAIRGDVPWTNDECRRAGTLHIGGRLDEVAAAEAQINRGVLPERPFVLVGQQYLADPSRSAGGLNPLWSYAHVPSGPGDEQAATERLIAQIERFAPGFRDRIVSMHVRGTTAMEAYNPNYIGGDIGVGANTARQVIVRPRLTPHPYATGVPGVYLCSSAASPAAGVHGMGGYFAAAEALRYLVNAT